MRPALVLLGVLTACAPNRRAPLPPPVSAMVPDVRPMPAPSSSIAEDGSRATPESGMPAEPIGSLPRQPELAPASAPPTSSPGEARALPAFEIEPPCAPGQAPRARPTGLVAASAADEELARWNVGGNSDPEYPSSRPGFHPAVRVTVGVRPLRRIPKESRNTAILSERRLLAIARNLGYWPFRACFEASLRRRPERPGGASRVRIGIATNGRVTAARRIASELRDGEAERCLERASRTLHFEPAPVRRLDVELTIELWPGDVPLPRFEVNTPPPTFDGVEIARVTNARANELAACCAAGLSRDARLWGRAALRVSIASDGRVTEVREDGSQFPDPEVVRCFAGALGTQEPLATRGAAFDYALGLRCGTPATAPPETSVPQASNGETPE